MESLALGARTRKAVPGKKKKPDGVLHKWLPNPLHRTIAKHASFFLVSALGFVWLGESLNPAQLTVD